MLYTELEWAGMLSCSREKLRRTKVRTRIYEGILVVKALTIIILYLYGGSDCG